MFINIISGKGTEAQNNVVCANAGMAIATVTKCTPLEGFSNRKKSLLSEKDFYLKEIERFAYLTLKTKTNLYSDWNFSIFK
jgi:hypothetical protein